MNQTTERIVRNFKPGKLRRLPDNQRNVEQKLSQLADSNMTPLGLFNQDLHAKREWNKLVAQKNFSSTLNDKQMTFKDAMIHEILMPLSPPAEANRTANVLMPLTEDSRAPDTFTQLEASQDGTRSGLAGKSPKDKDGKANDTYQGDNSTLQSPQSSSHDNSKLPAGQRLGQNYEKPRVRV